MNKPLTDFNLRRDTSEVIKTGMDSVSANKDDIKKTILSSPSCSQEFRCGLSQEAIDTQRVTEQLLMLSNPAFIDRTFSESFDIKRVLTSDAYRMNSQELSLSQQTVVLSQNELSESQVANDSLFWGLQQRTRAYSHTQALSPFAAVTAPFVSSNEASPVKKQSFLKEEQVKAVLLMPGVNICKAKANIIIRKMSRRRHRSGKPSFQF